MGISQEQWSAARAAASAERIERIAKQWQSARAVQLNKDLRQEMRVVPGTNRPTKTFTYLQLACRAADAAKVCEILAQGFSPNTPGPFGWTALHVTAMAYASTAADNRQVTLNTIAQCLLDAGADVTARDAMGLTPMACSNGVVPPAIRKAALAAFKPEPDLVCERESGARERKYRVLG